MNIGRRTIEGIKLDPDDFTENNKCKRTNKHETWQIVIKEDSKPEIQISGHGPFGSGKYTESLDYKMDIEADEDGIECFLACSRKEAEAFVEEWNRLATPWREKDRMASDYYAELVRICKTSLRVDLRAHVQKRLDHIRFFRNNLNTNLEQEVLYAMSNLAWHMENVEDLGGLIDRERQEFVSQQAIDQEQRLVHVNIEMNFRDLLSILSSKGIQLKAIECPKCGAPCSIPEQGSSFNCSACGSQIIVNDIYEKFKGILGLKQ